MWYRTSRIKSLPSGQLYTDFFNETKQINPEEYFTLDYKYTTEQNPIGPVKRRFSLEFEYPSKKSSKLIITALNKINNSPAAKIEILFPSTHPKFAVVDDIKLFHRDYKDIAKTYNQTPLPEDYSYAKHGLANLLYKKSIEWINENKSEVEHLTGFISSKEAYQSRIKALGKPSFIKARDNYPPEAIEHLLEPAIINQKKISYPDQGQQFEVRHNIKEKTNTNPSIDKT